jgi:hypothetical protein
MQLNIRMNKKNPKKSEIEEQRSQRQISKTLNKIENKIGTLRNGKTKLNNKRPSLRKYQFRISDLPQKRENLGHR